MIVRIPTISFALALLPSLAAAQPASTSTPQPSASQASPEAPSFIRLAPPRHDGANVLDPTGLTVTGYLQVQHEWSQLSEDQLQQGGVPYNRDRFLVRRGRIRLDGTWRYASAAIEIDGSTTRGPTFGLRRAEASLLLRSRYAGRPPYVALTAGLTDIPFGYELPSGARNRVFMERSLGSLAYFRGEPDLGVRLSGGVAFFRYALALMNGTPLDDRAGASNTDPTAAKDLVARLGVDVGGERWHLAAGTSFLSGTGFHPGTDASPGGVQWRDLNENSAIDAGELTSVPARAATPSQNFDRWAVGLDVSARLRTRLGWTHVYAEATLASNLDRSVFVADPVSAGTDLRHVSFYVAATQEITRYALVGFRYDYYDGNADFTDSRRGRQVPTSLAVQTLSPVVGAVLPDRARLLFQYDVILDLFARDTRGVPTDLRNNQATLRLQMEF